MTVWDTYLLKSHDLLNDLSHIPPHLHQAKFDFRLTVPLMIKIIGESYMLIYGIKFLCGIGLIVVVRKLIFRITKDQVVALIFTTGLIFIYYGRAGFIVHPIFDMIAYFLLALCFLARRPLLVFVFAFIACWLDERAFVSLPIVILFHQIMVSKAKPMKLKGVLLLTKQSWAVVVSMVSYLAIRALLSAQFGLSTPISPPIMEVLEKNTEFFGMGVWTAFEGFWLVVLVGSLLLFKLKEHLVIFLLFSIMSVLISLACVVNDITRSAAYAVPVLFIFVHYLVANSKLDELRFLTTSAMVVSLLFPAYFVLNGIKYYAPFFLELYDYI